MSECPACGNDRVVSSSQHEELHYGSGAAAVLLTVWVKIFECLDCDFTFAGEEAEQARSNAIAQHLRNISNTPFDSPPPEE